MDRYALRSKGDPPLVAEENQTDRQTTDQSEHQTTTNLPATTVVPISPNMEERRFQTSPSSSFEFEFELAQTFLDLFKSIFVE